MEIKRHFLKTTLSYIITASRSDHAVSAMGFFIRPVKLTNEEKNNKEYYCNLWGDILIDNINLLPMEKREIITIHFVGPDSVNNGFGMAGTSLKYDIFAHRRYSLLIKENNE